MTVLETEGLAAGPETPFAETPFADATGAEAAETTPLGFLPWTETTTPFAELPFGSSEWGGESGEAVAKAFEALRDEQFDETLAELVAETSEAADVRLAGEAPGQLGDQRQQLAEAHLAPVAAEAERCLQRFAEEFQGLDVEAMSPDQLDEVLGRFDPRLGEVSPAGEEFIGGLIKKARNVVSTVVRTAGKVVSALPVLGPILNKLKGLVRPLLKRVLAMAIGKLPPALHAPARALAKRFGIGEVEADQLLELEEEDEGEAFGEEMARTPVSAMDPRSLSESFDAALAESVVGGESLEEGETFGHEERFDAVAEAGTQLEGLAEARSLFAQQLQAAQEGEDLTPAMDQFVPAILPALRLGVRLVGRPKVVNFLSGFLAKLIGRWVGPQLSGPLSSAIVDVGLRVVGLEQGTPGTMEQEAAPMMLAATVEDTVRRLAEQPEAMLEDEQLLQLAVAEAFEASVAANFPSQLVRPDLQIAPTLGGSFVTQHPRQTYAYKKFSRTPEVTVTHAMASAVHSFRGVTLDASIRALGLSLPLKGRVHIYEALPGTTLPRLASLEQIGGSAHPRGAYGRLHPLTSAAAATLLREPRLGVDVAGRFLTSRHRIAVGQRFFYLEPVDQTVTVAPRRPAPGTAGSAVTGTCDPASPSETRLHVSVRNAEARLTMFFSEADAQRLAVALTARPGSHAPLLKALTTAAFRVSRRLGRTDGAVRMAREDELEWFDEAESEDELRRRPLPGRRRPLPGALRGGVRHQVRAQAVRVLAAWAATGSQEFVRAAQDPACGVTVQVHLRGLAVTGSVRQPLASPGVGAAGGVTARPGRHLT